MLRSLVGSEMCIRDRCSAPLSDRPDVADLARDPFDGALAARSRAACGVCLLYTSDAADDLLCVDLGGRRILKKKKQLNIQQHRNTAATSTVHRYDAQITILIQS